MQNQGQHPGVSQHWNQVPERPGQVSFGDRMNVGDKELSDLLDFSAMFSPPAPAATSAVKNGMTESGSLFAHGYKTTAVRNIDGWGMVDPLPPLLIVILVIPQYDDHNGQYNGTGAEHIEHFLGPSGAEGMWMLLLFPYLLL
ncbi:unnamed protein product, partial [Candidula unifasciata]